ncbi:MAG: DUF1848 domain-containing protein [Dysgonamonadaceae bacterium]|jgi:DNA repair photolyase|nr:DUF1848 domain-containing protein [Dysgonamonadaceae bacterium]
MNIKNQSGAEVEAHAPVIISASRSTDIPAFFAQWFINRLRAGYCVWYNPFNQQPMYISFKNCRAVVFWTKNPKPLIPLLNELDDRGINYYFQFSLNDYEKERFEPNLPPLQKRIETLKELSETIGKEKVVWRFDPMILTDTITPREILTRVWNIGNQLNGYTDKLVFSFADIGGVYKKVQNNLKRENIPYIEFTEATMNEIAEGLMKIRNNWAENGWIISLGTCAEQIDLERYSIEHNRCIDGELMKRIFSDDPDLVYYLNYGKLPEKGEKLFEDENFPSLKNLESLTPAKLKDEGQRKACGCMISKDIGMYNTCSHFCVYCYANTSKEAVELNRKRHDDHNESIIK